MRTKEQKAYMRKMDAWVNQQKISIADSKNRIEFAKKQIKNCHLLIKCEQEQLKIDTSLTKAELAKYKRWLNQNPE